MQRSIGGRLQMWGRSRGMASPAGPSRAVSSAQTLRASQEAPSTGQPRPWLSEGCRVASYPSSREGAGSDSLSW